MSKNEKFSELSKNLFFCGIFILCFIFFNIFISSTLFIFKISINKCTSIVSLLLSSILVCYLIFKNCKQFKKSCILTVTTSIVLITLSLFLSSKIYDNTWDGNSYHKSTIGMMTEGWNPVYEKMEEFDSTNKNSIHINKNNYLWGNHYAKASHIFAASIVKITGKIESGKSINILSIIMLFLFIFSSLLYETKKLLSSIMFTICITTLPTITSQILTNYVDILVYIYFFQIISIFFLIDKSKLFKNNNELLLVYFMSLIIAINIKFSLFGYVGIYCLGYYIWYIYRLFKKDISKKYFIKFTTLSAIGVFVAIFIVGLSVYPKNYLEYGHPFYPIRGENKVEIMIQNQPDYFKEKNNIEKFIISTFSKAANISEASGLKAEYKIPFSISDDEIKELSSCDLRIGGNGLLYSGIVTICLILLIYLLIKAYKKDKKLVFLIIIPTLITIIMIFALNESWWARYFPQLHLITLGTLLLLLLNNSKTSKYIFYVIATILLINNFITFNKCIEKSVEFTNEANNNFKILEMNSPQKCVLNIYTKFFQGAIYNVLEREKDYSFQYIENEEYEKNSNDYNDLIGGYLKWKCGRHLTKQNE